MVQCGIIGFLEKKQRVMQTLVSLRKSVLMVWSGRIVGNEF